MDSLIYICRLVDGLFIFISLSQLFRPSLKCLICKLRALCNKKVDRALPVILILYLAWEKFNATATAAGTNVDEFDDSQFNASINILNEIAERYYVHKML